MENSGHLATNTERDRYRRFLVFTATSTWFLIYRESSTANYKLPSPFSFANWSQQC